VPHSEPFLRPELVARCATAGVALRLVEGDPQFCSPCNTTYRRHDCERVARTVTSDAVTVHSHTGFMWLSGCLDEDLAFGAHRSTRESRYFKKAVYGFFGW
jgi:hypothetical protein